MYNKNVLRNEERRILEENMSSFAHIVELASPVFGEAFLQNGYLYYYDGATVTFLPERIKGEADRESLRETIKQIAEMRRPRDIIVWGHAKDRSAYKIDGYEIYYQKEIPFISRWNTIGKTHGGSNGCSRPSNRH